MASQQEEQEKQLPHDQRPYSANPAERIQMWREGEQVSPGRSNGGSAQNNEGPKSWQEILPSLGEGLTYALHEQSGSPWDRRGGLRSEEIGTGSRAAALRLGKPSGAKLYACGRYSGADESARPGQLLPHQTHVGTGPKTRRPEPTIIWWSGPSTSLAPRQTRNLEIVPPDIAHCFAESQAR